MPRYSISPPPTTWTLPRQFEGLSQISPLEVTVDVLGSENVMSNWRTLSGAMQDQALATTRAAAQMIFQESGEEVPYATGNLHDNEFIEEDEDINGGPIRIYVGYNTEGAPYAWIQHENLEYEHAPGRKAHYLSDPYDRAREKYPDALVQDLRETIQKQNLPRLIKKPRP